ncbi:MAG: hypothetical protein WBF17_16965 [Phycisphaerae bacterium]
MTWRRVFASVLTAALVSTAAVAQEVVITEWISPALGNWSDARGWTEGEPDAAAIALVRGYRTVQVTEDGEACLSLTIGDLGGGPGPAESGVVQVVSGGLAVGGAIDLHAGELTQYGGTVAVDTLRVAYALDETNTVWRARGHLDAGEVLIRGGQFVQAGGTAEVGTFNVEYVAGATVTVTLTGGEMTAGDVLVRGGQLAQDGGRLSVPGNLSISSGGEEEREVAGRLELSGDGVLEAGSVLVGGAEGPGEYLQSGGTATVDAIRVDYAAGATVTTTISGGEMIAGEVLVRGGQFSQSGGTVTVDRLNVEYAADMTVTVTISGGEMTAGEVLVRGGQFVQSGGRTTADAIRVEYAADSTSTVAPSARLTDGLLGAGEVLVRGGQFAQSGGTATVDRLSVEYVADVTSTVLRSTVLLSGGDMTAGEVLVHGGQFAQSGGTVTVDRLNAEYAADMPMTVTISGGEMTAGEVLVRGGQFVQSDGRMTVDRLNAEYAADMPVTVTITGGEMTAGDVLVSGGRLAQAGGLLRVPRSLTISGGGAKGEVPGRFELSGDGVLEAGSVRLGGAEGPGEYVQSGGTASMNALRVEYMASGIFTTTINLHSGDLQAGEVGVNQGTLAVSTARLYVGSLFISPMGGGGLAIDDDQAEIVVEHYLAFGEDAVLEAVPGSTIRTSAREIDNFSTSPESMPGLSNLTLVLDPPVRGVQTIEVAGRDLGVDWAAYDDNFALDGLTQLPQEFATVRLVDLQENQPDWKAREALYVGTLNIPPEGTLDLHGLNLYYIDGSIEGDVIDTVGGGGLILMPAPAALALLSVGALAAILRRRTTRAPR